MGKQVWHLKNCDLFERLSDQDAQFVESRSFAKTIGRGTPVYLPTDHSNGVFLLTKGRIKICHLTAEGKQSILGFVNAGEIFGELALLDQQLREEHAEAVEKSQVVLIPREVMDEVCLRHASVSIGITKLIGMRRIQIERRLKHLLFQSNKERLVHLLLDLVAQYGRQTQDEGIALSINLSHQDLASLIGSTRESVTLLLGELQNAELIKTARRKVWVLKLAELARVVGAVAPKLATPQQSVLSTPGMFEFQQKRI